MTRRIWDLLIPTLALAFALALTGAGIASADTTLGTTAQPAGSSPSGCASTVAFGQSSSGTTPYALPSAGVVKQWSTKVTGATPGADVYLIVVRPSTGTVVGVDHEVVPTPLPAGGVATFTVASPFLAQAGDYLGLYSTSSSQTCFWQNGSASGTVSVLANPGPAPLAGPPTPGQTVSTVGAIPTAQVNVSAVVAPAVADVSVSAGVAPARPTVGTLGVLQGSVVNHGPQAATVTFTDVVPAGLTAEAATAGGGGCSVAGQQVTCVIPNLASGATSAVNVIVTFAKQGTYTNSVSISPQSGITDPNPGNNSATAAFSVGPPSITSACVVPKLKGTPAGVAKKVLKLLGCTVKVKKKKGHGVPKGTVLKTKPGVGTYAFGKKITLFVRK